MCTPVDTMQALHVHKYTPSNYCLPAYPVDVHICSLASHNDF